MFYVSPCLPVRESRLSEIWSRGRSGNRLPDSLPTRPQPQHCCSFCLMSVWRCVYAGGRAEPHQSLTAGPAWRPSSPRTEIPPPVMLHASPQRAPVPCMAGWLLPAPRHPLRTSCGMCHMTLHPSPPSLQASPWHRLRKEKADLSLPEPCGSTAWFL